MKKRWIASQIKDLLTSFPAENSRMKKKLYVALAALVLATAAVVMCVASAYAGVLSLLASFVPIVFFSGVRLFSAGISGLHISKIYTEVKQRPMYIVMFFFGGG